LNNKTYSHEQEGTSDFWEWAIELGKTNTFIFIVMEPDLIDSVLDDLVLVQTFVVVRSSFLGRMQSGRMQSA